MCSGAGVHGRVLGGFSLDGGWIGRRIYVVCLCLLCLVPKHKQSSIGDHHSAIHSCSFPKHKRRWCFKENEERVEDGIHFRIIYILQV